MALPLTSIQALAAPPPVPRTEQTAPEGPAEAATVDVKAAPPREKIGCHGSRRCERLVILGSITTALGAATTITGVVLAALPSDPDHSPRAQSAGVTTGVIGGAILATGVVMLIAALKRKRVRGQVKR